MDSDKVWIGRLEKRLVPLSVSQDPLEATCEWYFTGEVLENSVPCCQLCKRPELRFNFEIENRRTGKKLMVGSICILNFPGIAIYNADNELAESPDVRKEILNQALKKAKEEKMLEPLRNIIRGDRVLRDRVVECVNRYRECGAFAPADLHYLITEMDRLSIPYSTGDYKVYLRSKSAQSEWDHLSNEGKAALMPALTPQQRSRMDCILH